jgi:hypothetical protein
MIGDHYSRRFRLVILRSGHLRSGHQTLRLEHPRRRHPSRLTMVVSPTERDSGRGLY